MSLHLNAGMAVRPFGTSDWNDLYDDLLVIVDAPLDAQVWWFMHVSGAAMSKAVLDGGPRSEGVPRVLDITFSMALEYHREWSE